ncbi:hypothetical protein ACFWWB_29475 [Streptomyces sp. NPDC058690]|uniref:hypothetical protein n=1 Tax=Streptomyces sp. NPDC058690 TaxID=3346600 RepID=UPI003651A63B
MLITVSLPPREHRPAMCLPRTNRPDEAHPDLTIAEPAVEGLRPDEPDVAFGGCWIDLHQLLGNAGALRKILLFVLFERALLGPARFAEEFGIGHMAGRSNATRPLIGDAAQPMTAVSVSAARANPSCSCASNPEVRTPAPDAIR